jgi:hypothetical protein
MADRPETALERSNRMRRLRVATDGQGSIYLPHYGVWLTIEECEGLRYHLRLAQKQAEDEIRYCEAAPPRGQNQEDG